jgi:hypothetical protein
MTLIYVHPSAVGLPDAADQLGHLVDSGHELVFLGDVPATVAAAMPRLERAAELPSDVDRGSWLLTADPEACGERKPGLQTLLIGPRAAPSPRPGPRCDAEARDLATAVLEILSRDVMG